eukprot:SAG31_NODE_34308_length_334_cov_0.885106_1_plen_75_part_01
MSTSLHDRPERRRCIGGATGEAAAAAAEGEGAGAGAGGGSGIGEQRGGGTGVKPFGTVRAPANGQQRDRGLQPY